jgi:hypothetical protein
MRFVSFVSRPWWQRAWLALFGKSGAVGTAYALVGLGVVALSSLAAISAPSLGQSTRSISKLAMNERSQQDRAGQCEVALASRKSILKGFTGWFFSADETTRGSLPIGRLFGWRWFAISGARSFAHKFPKLAWLLLTSRKAKRQGRAA